MPSHLGPAFPPGPDDAVDHVEILQLGGVAPETASRFRAGADCRGFTYGEYLTTLLDLHRRLRERADGGDEVLTTLLDELRLGKIVV